MQRRQAIGASLLLGAVGVAALGVPLGAQLVTPTGDLPDGSPAAPALTTAADTTSVQSVLQNSDVDAFAICVQDPAALHLSVYGVTTTGTRTNLDTVLFLLDAEGTLVAANDDTPSPDPSFPRRSEIHPGTFVTSPGVHTVAVGHFRTQPRLADQTEMLVTEGPLASWYAGFGVNEAGWRADLLGGAVGSEACAAEPPTEPGVEGAGVATGNGRCQALGGKAVEKGRAAGLEQAAEHRQNEPC